MDRCKKTEKWLIAWLKWEEKMQCLKFYLSVLLLIIKISQWACKNLHRYCTIFYRLHFQWVYGHQQIDMGCLRGYYFLKKLLKQHCKGAARSFVRKYKFKCKVCLLFILCVMQDRDCCKQLSTNTISNKFWTNQNVHTVLAELF